MFDFAQMTAPDPGIKAVIDRIEAELHRDVGRGMAAVFRATEGGLFSAASALADTSSPRIGLITGFYVPGGNPAAAETDGPAAAALIARAFSAAGLTCRVATDTLCADACAVALQAAGAGAVPVDMLAPGAEAQGLIGLWRRAGIDWVVAIERCGPSADGIPRNMRGLDMTAFVAPLDRLLMAGPWRSIAVGDGGNELGMGMVSHQLITDSVLHGDRVACVIQADYLIASGVSHWAAYALMGALGLLRPDWRDAAWATFDPELDLRIVEAMVSDGPAVDGVTQERHVSIDSRTMAEHQVVMAAIRRWLEPASPTRGP